MLRNKEVRQLAACFGALTVLSAAAGFALQWEAGLLALVSAGCFGALFWAFTRARYQSLARLAEEIDLVLHHAQVLSIQEAREGELSILSSEINKMTQRIREQNEALKREKTRLADSLADIAHQLRTPLTTANLILSLLKNEPDEAERKALLREMEELFIQMEWLIGALLKLSRLDAGIVTFRQEPVAVCELLDASLRPLLITIELHDVALELDLAEGAVIWGDVGWLAEAIGNVLKNCLESVGDHGRLSITCEDNLLYTEIRLHDNGPGLAQEDLAHLFERFYRGQGAKSTGCGIGLALAQTIIKRQGGAITAKNHPQGGAVFAIRFPK